MPHSGDDEIISFVCMWKQTLRRDYICSVIVSPADASSQVKIPVVKLTNRLFEGIFINPLGFEAD